MIKNSTSDKKNEWFSDFFASIVVFLVALPLCMGIAIASGVPPALGLISGIVGGLIVGKFTGSPLQVSGPAAGLAVMVYDVVSQYGVGSLIPLGLIIGSTQIIAAKFKLGGWFRATSPALIKGMLAGIGVLIFASQFHLMLDQDSKGSGLNNLISIPDAIVGIFGTISSGTIPQAGTLGLLTILVMVVWGKMKFKAAKIIPGPLLAVILAGLAAGVFALSIKFINIPENIFEGLTFSNYKNSLSNLDGKFFILAFGMAFVASAETLLCVSAVDKMSGTNSNYDKEMLAQGIGNTISGFLGGLPITGVIVRSSANIESGGKTNKSAIMHGVWLLLLVMVFPQVLNYIPMSVLAAILVFTGWRLMNLKQAAQMFNKSKSEFLIYFVTVATIVGVDLLTGVITGFVLSILVMSMEMLKFRVEYNLNDDRVTQEIHVHGKVSFLNLPKLIKELDSYKPSDNEHSIHINVSNIEYMDSAVHEHIDHWSKQLSHRGNDVKVIN